MKGTIVLGFIAFFVLVICFIPWMLMTCWNYVIPYIFHLPTITFWQAWALMFVVSILNGTMYRFTTERGKK